MTKRHFEMIARVVSSITNVNNRRSVAEAFAAELAQENPRFDRRRFLDACGSTPAPALSPKRVDAEVNR